ncbi:MAG: hypothetical protein MUC49_15905 [Raineya sp.]|jgi:DNA-binding beta-propeller fold protein YncE|nr:hypothetical protein [Raineya sp.]
MKKMFRFSYVILFLAGLLTACTPSDPQPNIGKYGKGVLVVNEGNFSEKNGSLSFIKENNEVISDIFQTENGVAIGGIIQSVKGYNLSNFSSVADKFAIITNNTDQVIFTEANDLKVVSVLDGSAKQIENPQAFAVLGNKGYITNWGDIGKAFGANPEGFITEIDLQTRTFIRKIPTPNIRPQGIVAINNKLYVANNSTNTISVYNNTGSLIQTIIVANNPDKILIDNQNKLWVICLPNFGSDKGSLVRINPFTDQTELSIADVPVGSFNSKIALYNNKIYTVSKNKVYTVDLTSQLIAEFISNDYSIYGFGINPQNGDLYLGEGSFSQASRIRRLSNDGTLIREYLGGIGTNGFLFYN